MNINLKQTNNPISKVWQMGKQAVKEDRMDDARDCFDMGIAMVATYSDLHDDYSDELEIEGKRRGLWLMRFWVALEKNNLLLA